MQINMVVFEFGTDVNFGFFSRIPVFDSIADQVVENAKEFISTLMKLKPTSAKGTYVKSIYLSSTMSAGIKIDPKSVEE